MADDLTPYCDTLMRPTCSPPVSRLMLQRIFCVTSSIAMTSQIYTHLSVDAFAEASLKVINFQRAQQRKEKKKSVGNR